MSGFEVLDYNFQLHTKGGHTASFQVARQITVTTNQYNVWLSNQGRYIISKRDLSDTTNIPTTYYYGNNKDNFATDVNPSNIGALTYVEFHTMYENII